MAGKIAIALTVTTMIVLGTNVSFSQSSTTDQKDLQSTVDHALTSKVMTSAVYDGSVTPSATPVKQGTKVIISQSPTTDQKDLQSTVNDALTSKVMTSAVYDGSVTPSATSVKQENGTRESVMQSEIMTSLSTTKTTIMSTVKYLTTSDVSPDLEVTPTETAVTCPFEDLPDVSNGSFSCSEQVNVGYVCNLTCIENYYPSSVSQTRCLDVGSGVGQWSNVTELLCSAVACPLDHLPDVPNGFFSCTEGVNIGDVCNLTCRENYYPSLLSQTTCMDVGIGVGKWSNVTELVCSVDTCSFDDLPDVTSGVFDQSKCSGQNIDAVCKLTCSPGLYPDYSDATVCRSVGGQKAEWMVENVHECKDYWSETMTGCIRDHNDNPIYTLNADIAVCKELCMQEQSFACLSVDIGNNFCYLSSRNRQNIDLADEFVVPCYIPGLVYVERIDIASWSPEVNTCEKGLGYLWSGSLIDLDSCKLICSQTIGCCSLMFKDGMCHLSKSRRVTLFASYLNVTTPSDGCNWVYTERINKTCPLE